MTPEQEDFALRQCHPLYKEWEEAQAEWDEETHPEEDRQAAEEARWEMENDR